MKANLTAFSRRLRLAAAHGLFAAFGLALFAGLAAPAAAAGKGDTLENDILGLLFNGTAIADLAENDTTSPLANLYLSLHSADPTDAGNQTSSECAYTSYARVTTLRTSADWTVSGNAVNLANNEDFPAATGGSCTATHFCVGKAVSGTGQILYCGTITPNLTITNGVTPRLTTGTNITED